MRTKSRGNGQGSVYKPKGSPYWTAQVVIGWKPSSDGTRLIPVKRTKGGFKNKKDAALYCAQLFTLKKPARLTLRQLYDEWDPFYSPRVGKSTMDGYMYAFKHFAPLHDIYIDLITAADLQQCMDSCPSGKRTHENMKCVAGLLWHYAYDRELTDRDITKNLYTGNGVKMQREPITEEELKVIRSAVGVRPYADYVVCQCFLGFRPGEFLSLTKSCVTEKKNLLYITAGSKTAAGKNRPVPVPPPIEDLVRQRLSAPGTDLLFPRQKDLKQMSHEYYNKHIFKPLMKELNIAEGKVPYCTRHTYSDKLKDAKVSDKTKAALMGHTDYSFTQRAYQSVSEKELARAAKSIK